MKRPRPVEAASPVASPPARGAHDARSAAPAKASAKSAERRGKTSSGSKPSVSKTPSHDDDDEWRKYADVPLSRVTVCVWPRPADAASGSVPLAFQELDAQTVLIVPMQEADDVPLRESDICDLFSSVGGARVLGRGRAWGARDDAARDDGTGDVPASWILRLTPTGMKQLQSCPNAAPAIDPRDGRLRGIRGWLAAAESCRIAPRVLDRIVNEYMAGLDGAATAQGPASAGRAGRSDRAVPVIGAADEAAPGTDADGFTLVTYKSKTPRDADVLPDEEPDETLLSDNHKRKKKRGSVLLPDFYAFQRAGDKMSRLAALRSQFDSDRAKIAQIKAARQFRPY